jgi:hypothetical protein
MSNAYFLHVAGADGTAKNTQVHSKQHYSTATKYEIPLMQ